jgi:endonuclease III
MARFIKANAGLLVDKYNGNASNIWNDTPTSVEMYERFIEFRGIGQKKGSMAVNILVRDCDVPVSDKRGIDVSYDKHIRQVFLRSGLAEKDDLDHIIDVARLENPAYPGALDKPAWYIGRDWCFNQVPNCNKCPLGNVCARKVEIVIKGEE